MASPHDWLLVLAWLVVAALLVASRLMPSVSFGAYLLPPAIAIVSVAWFVSDEADTPLQKNYWWIFTHSALLVVGLVGVVLSLVCSLMYLRQHRRLKSRQPLATGSQLLDLETLSRWNWWTLVVSVPVISIGFAMGTALSLAASPASRDVSLTSFPILLLFALWIGLLGLTAWIVSKRTASGTAIAVRTAWACGIVLATVLSLTLLEPFGGLHGAPRRTSGEDISTATPLRLFEPTSQSHDATAEVRS